MTQCYTAPTFPSIRCDLSPLRQPVLTPFCRPYFRVASSLRETRAVFRRRAATGLPGFTPQQILMARGWTGQPLSVAPIKLGFVSLGGAISQERANAQAHLFGLPAPKLTILGTPGASDPGGANVENDLDFWIAWIWSEATGLPADITVACQPNTANAIADGHYALAQAGVQQSSCSWGAPWTQWTAAQIAYNEQKFAACQALGMWMNVASGDNSEDDGTSNPTVDYPCASAYALALGGVNLVLSGGGIASQSGWGDGRPGDEGGGGGLATSVPIPSWQAPVLAGKWRGVPDFAEVADPATGYTVLTDGQTISVGGTSGASPTAAGLLALARGVANLKGAIIPDDPHQLLYANEAGVFLDVTTGSDGNPAKSGYDLVTGLGTLILPNLVALLSGTSTSPTPAPAPPAPIPTPTPTPPAPVPVAGPTEAQVAAYVQQAMQGTEAKLPKVWQKSGAQILSLALADIESGLPALWGL